MKSNLKELFYNQLSKKTSKWSNYFDIYHRHFDKFLNQEINLLEIGVANGGSLELWHTYFGDKCNIFGIDIDSNVLNLKFNFDVNISIGNQKDNAFWEQYLHTVPYFDIVIDDGGHDMDDQLTTLINIFPHLNDGGLLLIEDAHTSYWENFGGGLGNPNSFIEKSKGLIDFLHRQHIFNMSPSEFLISTFKDLFSVSFYNSVVVFEKKKYEQAFPIENFKNKQSLWQDY